jgi:hypothetical protein
MQRFIGRRGFFIAAILFLAAAVFPLLTGGKFNAAFFVLAMAFLVISLGIAKKNVET